MAVVPITGVARASARRAAAAIVSACALAGCTAGIATASGGQAGAGANVSSLASATLEQCLTAVNQADRSATFSGQMVAVAGTWRMAMRFDLQEGSVGESSFHTINAPGLGVWKRSEAGVKIYKYVRQITNLPAPAVVRAIVQFRWLNDKGHPIKRAVRRTSVCVQPDQRPKLVVGQVRMAPLRASPLEDYKIVVENAGHSPALAFGVVLNVNGSAQTLQAPALNPGDHVLLDTQAPSCTAGSIVEVQLDPDHQVEEATGGGMSDTLPCSVLGA